MGTPLLTKQHTGHSPQQVGALPPPPSPMPAATVLALLDSATRVLVAEDDDGDVVYLLMEIVEIPAGNHLVPVKMLPDETCIFEAVWFPSKWDFRPLQMAGMVVAATLIEGLEKPGELFPGPWCSSWSHPSWHAANTALVDRISRDQAAHRAAIGSGP